MQKLTTTAILCIFICFSGSKAMADLSVSSRKAYLNLEPGDTVELYSQCSENKSNCQKTTRLDHTASVRVIEPPPETNPPSRKSQKSVFVEYSYLRNGSTIEGQGWIDARDVNDRPKNPFYGPTLEEDFLTCAAVPLQPLKIGACNSADLLETIENEKVVAVADQISPYVGFCGAAQVDLPKDPDEHNAYDDYILHRLKKSSPPLVRDEKNNLMSQEQMIEIDAMARTLYGENSGCFGSDHKGGLQYPMAIARVVLNRSEDKDRQSDYIRGAHASRKTNLTKILTSPTQFHVWSYTSNEDENPVLMKSLCPPQKVNGTFWKKGEKVSFEEQQIWTDALRIATEAVLFPQRFKKRTEEVRGYFMTAGNVKMLGMIEVFPSINGQKINNKDCLRLWEERLAQR